MNNSSDSTWVFGYGSLIWRPGFAYAEASPALLRGAHRCLCIYSHRHRGTPEQPGLVFGLLRGGSCQGMAFRVEPERWSEVREYLREREQVTGVYREAHRRIVLGDRRQVAALAFLVDEKHEQYAGRLDIESQIALVREARGASGANIEYVLNTARHLAELGVRDRQLFELVHRLKPGP
ncbi:MAG TPA: gamma-glutamylcyclotransferase [Devosiaceae bacterium]